MAVEQQSWYPRAAALGRGRLVQNEGHGLEQHPIPPQPNARRRSRRNNNRPVPEDPLESLAFHIERDENNVIEDVRPYGPVSDLSELHLKVNEKVSVADFRIRNSGRR